MRRRASGEGVKHSGDSASGGGVVLLSLGGGLVAGGGAPNIAPDKERAVAQSEMARIEGEVA